MDRPTALDLPQVEPLPEATQAYFDKCVEKLGMVPNVLRAYAFDIGKLDAFAGMYNELMLGPSGLTKLEREMIAVVVSAENRCFYCLTAHGAAVRALSGDPASRRDDGDELPRGGPDAAAARDAGLRGADDAGQRGDRRGRPRGAARRRASPSATSGTSRRWRRSSTCPTGWRARSICGRTRTTTRRRADVACGNSVLVLAYVLSQFFRRSLRCWPRRSPPISARAPRISR